jgi:lysophospholipase L1-like esterase
LTLLVAVVLSFCASYGFGESGSDSSRPERVPGSFADFDRRARAGENLTVVFFGASLTWGAAASDPETTSFRGLMAAKFREFYPEAKFTFVDAAIGGTDSVLGAFRLDRDVLAYKPDLVFVDFSANDSLEWAKPKTVRAYEAIIHRLIAEAGVPVVQMIFPFKSHATGNQRLFRQEAHQQLSKAYQTGLGDVVTHLRERIASGQVDPGLLWGKDTIHPLDAGYKEFAAVGWAAYRQAVEEQRVSRPPNEMIFGPAFTTVARVPWVTLQPEGGWKAAAPSDQGPLRDMLMSRWLDSVVEIHMSEAGEGPALSALVQGEVVMLWGESNPDGLTYKVHLDGKEMTIPGSKGTTVDSSQLGRRLGGNVHHAKVILEDLDPTRVHRVDIFPILQGESSKGVLRLESLCVAGSPAKVLSVSNNSEKP